MLPRIMARLDKFNVNELCYIVDSYNSHELLDKRLIKDLETQITLILKTNRDLSL